MDLLALRNKIKKKKPNFLRQDAHKKSKLKKKWRKPKGVHSKMKLKLKSYRKSASPGYCSPKKVKTLNRSGFKEILVYNISDLDNINKKTEAIKIGSTVGIKKRLEIAKKAKSLGLVIVNIKDIDKFLTRVEEEFSKKKQLKKKKFEEKEKSKKELEKKAKEKEEKEEPKTEKEEAEEKKELSEKLKEEPKKPKEVLPKKETLQKIRTKIPTTKK